MLAILRLRQNYERVLYLDLDLHHGDGMRLTDGFYEARLRFNGDGNRVIYKSLFPRESSTVTIIL